MSAASSSPCLSFFSRVISEVSGSQRGFRGGGFGHQQGRDGGGGFPSSGSSNNSRQEAPLTTCNMAPLQNRFPPRRNNDKSTESSGSGSQRYPRPARDRPSSTGRYREEHRHWVHNDLTPPPSSVRFTIVSYNILGVDNASQHWRELYAHIPYYIMDWDRRKGRLILELGLWSPDVICLQEVDRFEDLQNELVQQGYEGIYKGRSGGSTDGCALFWRTQRFRLLQEESIEYQELDMRHNVAQLCILQAVSREQDKGNSQTTNERAIDKCFVVCNIHVLFNPNRGDIKLGQVRHLLDKAYYLSQEWGGIPVIVAGDFNSIPQSPLYQYLCSSKLDVLCFDRRSISGQVEDSRTMRGSRVDRWTSAAEVRMISNGQGPCNSTSSSSLEWRHETTKYENSLTDIWQESRTNFSSQMIYSAEHIAMQTSSQIISYPWSSDELKLATGDASETLANHKFNLQSAYASVKGPLETRDSVGEPLVTTYHAKFMGTVDYIWFTDGLVPLKVLDFLPIHVLQRTKGLPSKKWGSDHMALACEFALVGNRRTLPVKDSSEDSETGDQVWV